jgi:hypothetical protein
MRTAVSLILSITLQLYLKLHRNLVYVCGTENTVIYSTLDNALLETESFD